MKKRTHLLATRYFTRRFNLSFPDRLCLYFGCICPDLTPMCLLRPHRYNSSSLGIISKFYLLDFSNRDWYYYFKVGYLSHYVADFFTQPHNREGIRGFCLNHRGYENKLAKYFKDNIGSIECVSPDSYEFEKYLRGYHNKYISSDTCIEMDFEYICKMLYCMLAFCCS